MMKKWLAFLLAAALLAVLSLSAVAENEFDMQDALELVDKYRTEGLSHKAACKKAAADTGFSANELYDASLNK